MMRRIALLPLAAALTLASAAVAQEVPRPLIALQDRAPGQLQPGQAIALDALAKYSHEELRLYHSERGAGLNLIYPYCLSGNAARLDYADRQALDGKWVRVAGTLAAADELDARHGLFLLDSDGVRFRNDCVGPYVLRIDTVEPTDPALYAPVDCLARTASFCLPPEYDPYWQYSGALSLRVPQPKLDGPVTIYVSSTDHFFARPVTGMSRRTVGDYTVFYTLACPSDVACTLIAASIPSYGLTANPQVPDKPFVRIVGKTPAALQAALAKVRYCPSGSCAGGPSIALIEFAAEAQRQQ